jgi:ribosomal protein S18 acetylase RimI-like enzyme
MEAFAGHWGCQYRPREEWAAMSVRSDAFLPELSLLAFDGGQLAGYLLSYTDADPTRLYLGQVGVRPEWRRRGLASALLVRALATAATAGKSSAALGVDADSPTGAVSVYQRTGFVVENRAITYATAIAAPTATVRNATGARSRGRGRP